MSPRKDKDNEVMALSTTERSILDNIGKDAREARDASIKTATLQEQHAEQLTKLFQTTDFHANEITKNTMFREDHKQAENTNLNKDNNTWMKIGILVSMIIGIAAIVVQFVK
jgi:hypothetical protein